MRFKIETRVLKVLEISERSQGYAGASTSERGGEAIPSEKSRRMGPSDRFGLMVWHSLLFDIYLIYLTT
jgi:hypothetical protein